MNIGTIPNYLLIGCMCAGKSNLDPRGPRGSECKLYGDYDDDWYNGYWCFANLATCPDAKTSPGLQKILPGYGASQAACKGICS